MSQKMSARQTDVEELTIETWEEEIGDSSYTRLKTGESHKVLGLRINGHGKIVSVSASVGEHHPTVVRFSDSDHIATVHELKEGFVGEIDGRHNRIVHFDHDE